MQIFSAGRTGRDGTGRDQPKVVQEVLADLKINRRVYKSKVASKILG